MQVREQLTYLILVGFSTGMCTFSPSGCGQADGRQSRTEYSTQPHRVRVFSLVSIVALSGVRGDDEARRGAWRKMSFSTSLDALFQVISPLSPRRRVETLEWTVPGDSILRIPS